MPHSLIDLAGLKVGAEDFLAAVVETTAQPTWVVDPDDVIRFANPAALAALGYDDAGALSGRRSHETIHRRRPDGTPCADEECPLRAPRDADQAIASDLDWLTRRDGSLLPVSYVAVPLALPEGRGAVVTFTDASERVRAEQLRRRHEASLAAQRRVAGLVARGAASEEVFAAIAREVGEVIGLPLIALWRYEPDQAATVIGAWSDRPHPFQAGTRWPLDGPTICAKVRETGRPARIDDFSDVPGTIGDAARRAGIRSCAGAPIVVDGRVWGVMSTDSTDRAPLPDDIEERLAEFTAMVATAISNSASREELARLASEQAALRRVATLVARRVPAAEVFAAVAREACLLLAVDVAHMARYEPDGTATGIAAWSLTGDHQPVGRQIKPDGESVATKVLRTGRPARIDNYEHLPGQAAALGRQLGLGSSVGAPILVDRRIWGVLIVSSKDKRPLPAATESRVAAFSALVATAISGTDARVAAGRLAGEQAALRRVATLVARGVPQGELFAAVAAEVGQLFGTDYSGMIRYDAAGTVTPVAAWAAVGEHPRLPDGWATEDGDPATIIEQTRRPARVTDWTAVPGPIARFIRDMGITSSVGSPILVEARLWGALAVHSKQPDALPQDTESRLENFTELVATAISNSQARADLAASRARIVAATDEERRRVVRDLHDGAQQRLVHTIITLKLARRAVRTEEQDDEKVPALLNEALRHAERATAELRELAHGILPAVLTQGGLGAGVDALASRMVVPVEHDVSVGELPSPIEATAYFVIAEALTNVAKHARAQQAWVTARVEEATLRVEVRDDGIGGARRDGTGLLGLTDRMAVFEGRLRVESPEGGGTLVAADFPLPSAP